jgi:hypothetical protein
LKINGISEEHATNMKQVLVLFFDPADGGDMFIPNVG